MTKVAKKVQERIKEIAGLSEWPILSGYVKSVDEDKMTMVVALNGSDIEIEDVLLNGVPEGGEGIDVTAGVLLIPEVDSDVIIGSVDAPGEYVLLRASKVKKIIANEVSEIEINATTSIKMNCDEIILNDGENDGVPITANIVSEINEIKQDVNNLKTAFQSALTTPAMEPGNGAPSAFQVALNAAVSSWYGQQLQNTTDSDIKNDKVKH